MKQKEKIIILEKDFTHLSSGNPDIIGLEYIQKTLSFYNLFNENECSIVLKYMHYFIDIKIALGFISKKDKALEQAIDVEKYLERFVRISQNASIHLIFEELMLLYIDANNARGFIESLTFDYDFVKRIHNAQEAMKQLGIQLSMDKISETYLTQKCIEDCLEELGWKK